MKLFLTIALATLLAASGKSADTYIREQGKLLKIGKCEGALLGPTTREMLVTPDPLEFVKLRATALRNQLVVLQRNSDPTAALLALADRPKRISVLFDFPRTPREAVDIHGKSAVKGVAQSYFDKINSQISELAESAIRVAPKSEAEPKFVRLEKAGAISISEVVRTQLERGEAGELYLLVGHIDGKGDLHFHDGSSININGTTCRSRVWVVGCNTLRLLDKPVDFGFATGSRLSYDEATWIVGSVVGSLSIKGQNFEDAMLNLQNRVSTVEQVKVTPPPKAPVLLAQTGTNAAVLGCEESQNSATASNYYEQPESAFVRRDPCDKSRNSRCTGQKGSV
jgi:hypothetical protein